MPRALLAAAFGAACIVLAFPTIGWAWPVLFAWAPLLAVSRELSWKRRLLAGWVLGAGYNLVLFRWVSFTMQEMSSMPLAAAFGVLLVFALWHGLLAGVFLALVEPIRRVATARAPWLGPFAITATWVGLEYLWPFVFPWVLGHAFWEVGPVHAGAALGGVEALSVEVMLVSATLAEVALARRWVRSCAPALVVAAALAAFGVAWWAWLDATPPRRSLRTAVLQLNYTIEEKKNANLRQRRDFMERLDAMLRRLEPDRHDLVVASEGAFPFYWDVEADRHPDPESRLPTRATLRVGRAVAAGSRTHTIVGGLRKPEPRARTRNAAIHFAPDGRILAHYDKNILVPFGEYLPLSRTFPSLVGAIPGVSDFEGGETPCDFDVAGEPVACGICYESIFADYTRDTVGDGALLVNLTIDVWFGQSTAPWFHLMGQCSRAAELGIPLVRSALTGVSAVVGPDGVPDATLPLDEAGVLDAEVPLRDVTTPYRVVGPWVRWLCLLGLLAGVIAAWRRRGSEPADP